MSCSENAREFDTVVGQKIPYSGNYFNQIRYLMIETNTNCNLKCQFCNREDLKAKGWREKKVLSTNEFRQILDVFRTCPIDTVKIEGISEPMLHPNFHTLATHVRNLFPKAFLIISTNLQYNIEKTPFEKTLPSIDMAYLSIDGIGKTFEAHRIGAKFKVFTRNGDWISKNIDSQSRKKLYLNFTATEFNYKQLEDVYALSDMWDLAGVRINLAQNWNEDQKNSHTFSNSMLDALRPYAQDVKGVGGWSYSQCFWPFSGITVDAFGNIRQCIINTSQKPIANVLEDKIEEVYNYGSHYVKTRAGLQGNCPPKACENCDYNHLSPILDDLFSGTGFQNDARTFLKYLPN